MTIYTDGGCSGNPGPGGWGYVILTDGNERVASGFEVETTNNRMELMAAIKALEAAKALRRGMVTVYTDSQYLKNGITAWMRGWKAKGWRTSSGDPVKNRDLWEALDRVNLAVMPQWEWVKGHAGNEHNERCDTLTQEAIARAKEAIASGAKA